LSENRLPEPLHRFFWDCRPEEIDLEGHAAYVLDRLLERGDDEAIRWVLARYGRDRVRAHLLSRRGRGLSPETYRYWALVLGVEGDSPWHPPTDGRSSRLVSPRPLNVWPA
jgi:hypothetical protein